MARMSRSLREAVAASMPCASEQYVTISMPGLVIDTSSSSPYISKEPVTSGRRNQVIVNEAKLVDNMIPLDQIMLGPTGKSVTRSYVSALDFLKPRDTTIGLFGKGNSEEKTEYSEALKFLKQKVEPPSSSGLKGANLANADLEGTVVGRYVRKQLAWAEAQGNWDAVRDEAEEDIELTGESQTAAAMKEKKLLIRKRKAELHARWMDWVVNGDKLQVDHYFALVDRSDLMARVEKAKASCSREATRDMLVLDPKDGTDWARVYLQPEHWARYCRTKADNWGKRNPVNLELLQMQIAKLEQEEIAYTAFESNKSEALAKFDPATEPTLATARAKVATEEAALEAAKSADPKKSDDELKGAEQKVIEAKGELEQATIKVKQDLTKSYDETITKAATSAEEHPDHLLVLALKKVNDWDQALRDAQNLTDGKQETTANTENKTSAWDILLGIATKVERVNRAQREVDAAKKNVMEMKKQRDDFKVKEGIFNMRTKNSTNTKLAAKEDLKNIQAQLVTLRAQLTEGRKSTVSTRQTIVDVSKKSGGAENDLELVRSDPVLDRQTGIATSNTGVDQDKADVWTKISFSVSGKSEQTSSSAIAYQAGLEAKYGNWFTNVSASTQVSGTSEKLQKSMAKCDMSVSFDALLVQIQRPWLHAELFSDFDVDASKDLSPGAQVVQSCISDPSPDNGIKLRPYGTFPAYPTAFIVAADTTLELHSTDSEAEEMASQLSTESSFNMNLGPWGVRGSAHLKTDSKNANQRMETKNGSLRISFQAPQIIGWVSEILPELPRKTTIGGLLGVPNQAFRVR
ncbi:hypothetical protein QBC41DRAFT_233719 [Cercophora samala]|uniref:Uncharacterized protein n=1 Tax=Cercophora samala TaxID=330535 RepID=A0AA39Z5F2_9PEZI|nr:hypothetical protein QBC41DRAFT_233719 [Cercophora samala]